MKTTDKTGNSERPLEYEISIHILSRDGVTVAECVEEKDGVEITKAANAHAALVSALERIANRDQIGTGKEAFDMCQLIAKEALAESRK